MIHQYVCVISQMDIKQVFRLPTLVEHERSHGILREKASYRQHSEHVKLKLNFKIPALTGGHSHHPPQSPPVNDDHAGTKHIHKLESLLPTPPYPIQPLVNIHCSITEICTDSRPW